MGTGKGNDRLAETMERTRIAIEKRWAEDKRDEEIVCLIDIPPQSLTIHGETSAKNVLQLLKCLKVTGTYRIRKGGANEGDRA